MSDEAGASAFPRPATAGELELWDGRVVHGPGGHAYQSLAWAEARRRAGWTPLPVMIDAEHGALVLTRRAPLVGSLSAYVPRGPVSAGEAGEVAAARVATLTTWLAGRGVDVLATDAEVPADERSYAATLRTAGFHAIAEIQPSRHRMSLALARDADDDAVRHGITKSTRQRIAAAERDGVVIVRHDTAGWAGSEPLFASPQTSPDAAFATFATLLEGTGQRRGFRFGPRAVFLDWWLAGLEAGLVVYLEARAAGTDPGDGRPAAVLGGLLCYRHGDRLSTVHSADAPGARDRVPGTMHLLRWRAIQLAIREGRSEMDLGGVDVAPDHREPRPGDPTAGLYEHKRSFGAQWVAMTGAHQRVIRPWRHGLGRVTARLGRLVAR